MDKYRIYKDVNDNVCVALEVSKSVFFSYIDMVSKYYSIHTKDIVVDDSNCTEYYANDNNIECSCDALGHIEHIQEPDWPQFI